MMKMMTPVRLMMLSLLLAVAGPLYAEVVGTVTHLSGILTVKRADSGVKVLSVKSEIAEGDLLSTEKDAYARIKFIDNAEVVLRPGSQLKVTSYAYTEARPADDKIALDMVKGGLRAVSGLIGKRNKEAVSFSTPTATIGIRGTHFGALFCQSDCGGVPTASGNTPPDGLHVDVAIGAVVVKNSGGAVVFNAGQFGYVANPQTLPVVVPASEGVQVRMPKSISANVSQGATKNSDAECIVQ